MLTLVQDIFSSFTTVVEGLAGGIKNAFGQLIYVDPTAASPTISPVVQFIFIMAGVGLATGILYKIFSLIKRRKA